MSSKSQTHRRRADELVSNHSLTAFALEVSIPKKCSILQCNSSLDRIALQYGAVVSKLFIKLCLFVLILCRKHIEIVFCDTSCHPVLIQPCE